MKLTNGSEVYEVKTRTQIEAFKSSGYYEVENNAILQRTIKSKQLETISKEEKHEGQSI